MIFIAHDFDMFKVDLPWQMQDASVWQVSYAVVKSMDIRAILKQQKYVQQCL